MLSSTGACPPHLKSTARAAAERLRELGFALCRPSPSAKNPTDKGWATRSSEPVEFMPGSMVGIQGGPLSDGNNPGHATVIVDLDAKSAVKKADNYLPITAMVEGRRGKPRSHRFYLVTLDTIPNWAHSHAPQAAPAAKAAKGHAGPFKKKFQHRETDECVLDFIGTGGQVVVPPSVWFDETSKRRERREWDGGQPGKPAIVPFPELWEAVCQLAESCGCKPPSGLHWPWEPEKPKAGPTSGGTGRTGDPGDVEKRAIAYLVKMPESVSEQGGHDRLFAAACAMVWGFALSEDRGFEIIKTHFNLRCRPEWSDREIRHKVEDVLKVASHAHPRGHLRDKPLPESPRIVVAGKPIAGGSGSAPSALLGTCNQISERAKQDGDPTRDPPPTVG